MRTETQLARCIFFANQGKFQAGDYEEIMNKASWLSLVSNAGYAVKPNIAES